MKERGTLYQESWQKLKKDKAAMFGLFVILFAVIIAVLGGNIRPDPSPYANDGVSAIARLPTRSTVTLLNVRKNKEIPIASFWDKLFFGGQLPIYAHVPVESYFFRNDSIVVNLFTSMRKTSKSRPIQQAYQLADVVYPISKKKEHQPYEEDGQIVFQTIDGETKRVGKEQLQKEIEQNNIVEQKYWLGTDVQGRDLLSRDMAGTIVSLSVGLISVIISLIIGVFLGAVSGYYRGVPDTMIMWLINVVWSIPTLLLIISVTLLLGKGFSTVFFAVGLTMWVELARIVRGQILSIREKEYIEAGKALGYSNYRIITKHIFPNIIGSVIVICASNFAAAILIEAGLSFLGIGAQIPMVSWGTMIEQHKSFITHADKAFLALVPGLSIILLVFAFMLLGNGLRDSFDTQNE